MKVSTNQERLNQLFDRDSRTDSAIADALSVSKQTISAWRNGSRSPKKPMLMKLAELYDVDIAWLMGYDEESHQEDAPPQTIEAKILSKGIDRLPKEQREQALAMFKVMFAPQYADLFTKENDDDT